MSGGNSPPGYEILATETIHAQSKTLLVGTGNVLAHVSDGHVILTSDDGTKTAKVSFPSLTKKTATCLDVELVNERPEIVVGFADGSVEAVSGTRGSSFTFPRPPEGSPRKRTAGCVAVAWVPGGGAQELVVVYGDGAVARLGRTPDDDCISFWDARLTMDPMDPLDAMRTSGADESVVAAALSPCLSADGRCLVALASSAGRLRVVDAGDGATIGGCSTFFGGCTCVAFSRDGMYVAVGGEDDVVTLLALSGSAKGAATVVHCQGHTSWPAAVAFENTSSPDPSCVRLWSAGLDGKVCAFEVQADDFPPGAGIVARCERKSDLCPVAPEFCVQVSSEPLRAIAMTKGGLLAIATRRKITRFSAVAPPPVVARGAPLPVESALLFQKQWGVYRKVLQNNELCHMDAIDSIARDFAASGVAAPRVLDIGCGDGAVFSAVLAKLEKEGKRVNMAHYTGVDASRAALDLNNVRASTKDLVEMELEDYLETGRDHSAYDAILANLILHHFDETGKRRIVRQIAGLLAENGVLYYGDVYETNPGEGRPALLQRWKSRMKTYKDLTAEELESVWQVRIRS